MGKNIDNFNKDTLGLLLEFISTIIFITLIINKNTLLLGISFLIFSIYISGLDKIQKISTFNSHLNPAVTLGILFKKGDYNSWMPFLTIFVQIIACFIAGMIVKKIEKC